MTAPRIIRVFPRRTTATPVDDLAVVGTPRFWDEADEVHISVAFEWDKERAEYLAKQWERVAPVTIGGPAYRDGGGEFTPGMYLQPGYVITSRGCPNACWFCAAWRNEGRQVRELTIRDGWDVLDNNLLACSVTHIDRVFCMLRRQKHPVKLSGGLEAARLEEWHVHELTRLKLKMAWFAYDTDDDRLPLRDAAVKLSDSGLFTSAHKIGCYVLCGFNSRGRRDTLDAAETRMKDTLAMGYMPQAMLYDRGRDWNEPERTEWRRFARTWANKIIIGSKMRAIQ